MSAEVSNIERFTEAVAHASHHHPEAIPLNHMSGEASINLLSSQMLFTTPQRAQFYSGKDRMMISREQLERVYELEKSNDQLQRQVFSSEHSLKSAKDPFAVLANIEHSKMMIAKNTGEILKIFDTTAFRLQRIAELEAQNQAMISENEEKQALWTTLHDMEERTHIASRIFMNKDLIVRNEVEITMLRNESAV